MRMGIPRYPIVAVAALFSAYIVGLGFYSLDRTRDPAHPDGVFWALGLFVTAVVISLWPARGGMPVWMAAFTTTVVISMAVLVSTEVDLARPGGTGYATWHVAAAGVLMTITSTRRRHGFAWAGISLLILHTVLWAGIGGLLDLGIVGSVTWVAVSHVLSVALSKAGRDARRFALAEREATDWNAAQEAHVFERQFRLGQTTAMAVAMLREIESSRGELTEVQRAECFTLEAGIRDEIRGRHLLSDDVRAEVMAARRRGALVTLLDEGGIDDLPPSEAERVHAALARALAETDADRIIVRTVPEGSDVAVTVVGLRGDDDESRLLGVEDEDEDEDDEDEDDGGIVLWLEIPRAVA